MQPGSSKSDLCRSQLTEEKIKTRKLFVYLTKNLFKKIVNCFIEMLELVYAHYYE